MKDNDHLICPHLEDKDYIICPNCNNKFRTEEWKRYEYYADYEPWEEIENTYLENCPRCKELLIIDFKREFTFRATKYNKI